MADVSWSQMMTTDAETIRAWFALDPDMNYGVCGGLHHAIIDLDVKGKANGVEAFGELETAQSFEDWVSCATLAVRSPSGGVHYYVRVDSPVGNSHGFPGGIDVRGGAGYVVGPGSKLIEGLCEARDVPGDYEVISEDFEIVAAPDWVQSRFRRAGEKAENAGKELFDTDQPFAISRALDFLRVRAPAVQGSGGNAHTYATAAQVKDFGISEAKCYELLTTPIFPPVQPDDGSEASPPRSWNDICEPPWGSDELEEVIYNAYKYGQKAIGAKGGGIMEAFEAEFDVAGESYEEVRKGRFDALREITFRGTDILRRNKMREMLVPEWMPAHGIIAFLAKRGIGKTTVMVDIALRAACDMEWHDLPMKEGRTAVYLCGEDDEGLESQIKAWCQLHEVEPAHDRLIVLAGVVDLMSAEAVSMWTEFLLEELAGRKAILFVDTWQRATSRGGQNKDEDMQIAVHHAEAMARSLGGPALIAFHPPSGNEDKVLGSTVIENSTTAIWKMTEETNGRKLQVTRIKGKGYGNFRLFKFAEVSLGIHDEFGNELTGVVPSKIGGIEDGRAGEALEQIEAVRTAYATVIRTLMQRSLEDDSDEARTKFSVSGIADEIEKMHVADDLRRTLINAGETGLSAGNVRKRLTKLFIDNSMPHEFDDGFQLACVKAHGNKRAFAVQVSQISQTQ